MKSLKKIHNSNEARNVIQNFAWLSLLQVAGYIFPLITIPYLAVTIGVDGFGKIAFATAVIIWFQTIADWGFNYTATRDVAQNRNDREKVSKIFSNVLWSRVSLTLVSFGILMLLISIVPLFKDNQLVLLVTFLMIPGHILFPDWFFQAVEKMKYITILNVLLKLIFTLLVFIFIKEKKDYYIQPLLTSFGYCICGIIALYIIIKKWHIRLFFPNLKDIINTIKNSFDVFLNNLAPNLYNSFSKTLLGFWGGSTANGLLDGGDKFSTIAYQFINLISRVFFPFLSRKIEKHKIFATINLTIGVAVAMFLIIFAPYIIELFLSAEFSNSITVLRILAVSVFFMALSNTYGTNFLIIIHKERVLRNITIIVSLIGFVISIPLVYFYSYIGAATSICICRTLLGVCTFIESKKLIKCRQ